MTSMTTFDPETLRDIYDELVEQYGPMMDLGEVAKVLRRNRNSVRIAVTSLEKKAKERDQSDDDSADEIYQSWAGQLLMTRCRVGKKILFRTQTVASILHSGLE